MIDSIQVMDSELKRNDKVEVTERIYEYMMNCLPPREMGFNYFIFQEGDGDRILFSKDGKGFYATLLGGIFFTNNWEIGIRLVREVKNSGFKVLSIFNTNHKACELFETYDGRLFRSIDEAGLFF